MQATRVGTHPRSFLASVTAGCTLHDVSTTELTAASFSAEERRRLAKSGAAMADGSFPIRNRSDLRHALRALGRARNVDAARTHIIARARALNLTGLLPDAWGITASMDGGAIVNPAWNFWPQGFVPSPPVLGWDYENVATNSMEPFVVAAMLETLPEIGLAPLVPNADWFRDQELTGPTPLTVTADGQVYGHLAEFGKCHRGIQGRCVMAPRSPTGYKHFNVGRILTDDGSQVDVGKLTVNAHHAPLSAGAAQTAAHYDHTGTVAAFVHAGEDKWGPWLAGATKSDATPEQIRDLRANPPSGDWRNPDGRGLDLVAALAVPVPGFPVMAVTASGDTEIATALLMQWGSVEEIALVSSAAPSGAADKIRFRASAARISGDPLDLLG